MSKHIGLNRAKQSDRQVKNDGKVLQAVREIAEKVTKFGKEWMDKHNSLAKLVSEWTEKHNKLGAVVEALFKNSTLEIGKIWGNEQAIQDSIEHMDLNVLALSEMNRLMILFVLQKVTGKPVEELEEEAEKLRKELQKVAFSVVQERLQKEREAKAAAEEKAAREAAEAKTEAEKAEAALKAAEAPVTLEEVNSGGPGVDIPEGATVFGG